MKDAFVSKSVGWDSPDKINMTNKFVAELFSLVNPLPTWKTLEIGAGTGLVGLQIEPFVRKVVMEDVSKSMLGVLTKKLNENNSNKVEILYGEVFDYTKQDIDFVFSCMAFHHIPDIESTLNHLYLITNSGAWVAVGDLEVEDGSFHQFEPTPHNGFDTKVLSKQFAQAGFEVKQVKRYNILARTVDSITRNYNQFILIAKRK